MQRLFIRSGFAILAVLIGGTLQAADDKKPVEGTLQIGKHTYKLAHVAVYETKADEETLVTLLASDRRIPFDKIKAALREGEGSDDRLSLTQPHVKVVFNAAGEVQHCSAWADNASFSTSGSGSLSGKLTLENQRARGEAKLAKQGDGNFERQFEVQFDAPLGLEAPKPSGKPAAPVKPTVTGTFKGNGQAAKLAFVSARPGEPFGGEASIVLIFTEKDHSKEKRPDIKAVFGDFGSALIISLHEDGRIFGCEVAHAAHDKKPFSSTGRIKTTEFDVGDGQVSGQITTEGELDAFKQTWDVDIKFAAPYSPPAAPAAAADKPASKSKPGDKPKSDKPKSDKPRTKPAEDKADADAVHVKDLPFPKDATDFEYKKLVGHLGFKSPAAVPALAAELSKNLEGQKWEKDGSDLINPKTAILRRKRGDASLTIFVKPAAKGSQVTIMSEGLDWSERKTEEE